ncbi:MAG TPA: DUF6350 family protein [Actinomycetes bacterium]
MTDLLSRPPGPRAPRRPPAGPPTRPLTVAGVLAAGQAAGLGALAVMVIVLVGWATAADSGASASTAVAGGLQVWLVGHHTRVLLPGGSFGLVPLGLTVLPLLLVHTATLRSARAAGITGRSGVLALTSSVTATYAVVATAVALLARTEEVRPMPMTAFVGSAVIAGVASGSAAVRATGRSAVLWYRLPALVRLSLPPAAVALGVLVAAGAALAGASLAGHHDRARALTDGLDPGVGGAALLVLGSLLYVPTAAVWGLGYSVGPGFSVGQGTSVSVLGSDLGAVPGLPLLAALPAGPGTAGPAGWAALAAPVVAGVLAAWLLRRRAGAPASPGTAGLSSWRALVAAAGAVGVAVGVGVGALAALAAGPAGPGRMAETGPDWWAVAPAAAIEVAAVVAVTLLVLRRRG